MKIINLTKTLIVTLVFSLIISCATDKDQNYTIEIVDGVKHIKNLNIPSNENLKVQIKKEITINGLDENSQDSLSMFSNIMAIDVDRDGNIYVCDAISSSIKKFDSEGNFVKSIGRLGKGPGEFEFPTSFVVLDDTL
jgi:DNA-binding beta-propeller fold protein YncE